MPYDTDAAIKRLEKVGLLEPLEAKKLEKKAKKKKKRMGAEIMKPISKEKYKGTTNKNSAKQLEALRKENY